MERNPFVMLLVEDDQEMRSLLCDELCDMELRILEARDGDEALQMALRTPPDLIVTDLRMPAGGLDYLQRLRTFVPNSPIILMTAFGDSKTREIALQLGVAAYFDKPVRLTDLKTAIRRLTGIPPPVKSNGKGR